jgi:hypothetical protein
MNKNFGLFGALKVTIFQPVLLTMVVLNTTCANLMNINHESTWWQLYGLPTQHTTKPDRNNYGKKVNMTIHKRKITWHIVVHIIHPYLTVLALQHQNFKK